MPISPSPAVLRACDVLGHLAHHPTEAFTVSELARDMEVPRATCDAILQALAAHRFVTRRDDDRRYELGPGSIALGNAARVANPVLRAAKTEAERLARALRSCVAIAVRDGNTTRVTEVFDFGPLFALRARVGQAIPLVPPFGAVFVAWSEDEAEGWIARAEATLEPDERDRYRRALAEVRRRGYSVAVAPSRRPELAEAFQTLASSPEADDARRETLLRDVMHSGYLPTDLDAEATLRVGQISTPVFDPSGRVTAALLVPGPDHDVASAELHAFAARIAEAAARATDNAGGLAPARSPDDGEAAAAPDPPHPTPRRRKVS